MLRRIKRRIEAFKTGLKNGGPPQWREVALPRLEILEHLLESIEEDKKSPLYLLSFTEAIEILVNNEGFIVKEGMDKGCYILMTKYGTFSVKDINRLGWEIPWSIHASEVTANYRFVPVASKKLLLEN